MSRTPVRRSGPRTPGRSRPPRDARDRAWSTLAWVACAALAAVSLFQLAAQAGRAVLYTDECFHAHVAQRIAAEGRLPDRMPELYGGLFYSYPPLLHLLGAAWIRIGGPATLPLLNVALAALLLLVLAALPVPGLAGTPRRWAVWLVAANAALATYAVRFYAEMLACVAGLAVALLLVRAARTRSVRDGAWLGLAGGLALLSKNTALLVPVLIAAWIAIEALARRRDGVWAGALALAVAIAIALPMFVRNQVLYGSPIYPGFARDVDPWLMQLNRARFGGSAAAYLNGVWGAFGPWLVTLATAAALVAVRTRRRDAMAALLAAAPAGVLVAMLSPLHEARHVLPLVPVVALVSAAIVVDALRARPGWMRAVEVALAAIAVIGVATLGDRRSPNDLPVPLRESYAAMRERLPAGARVLSLWTYDTQYYTGRATTWPIPWGQGERGPATLFRETSPDVFRDRLDRLEIDWVLMPRNPGGPAFDTANYPDDFARCVAALLQRNQLRVAWASAAMVLLQRVK